MSRGFFDYEGRDEDTPRTYYDSRVSKAKSEGTWTKPSPLRPAPPGWPKGAAASTASQSFWQAIMFTLLGVPRAIFTGFDALTSTGSALDVFGLVLAIAFTAAAWLHWRSWRVLRTHEAEHGVMAGQERADRLIRTGALVVVGLAVVATIVLAILTASGVLT